MSKLMKLLPCLAAALAVGAIAAPLASAATTIGNSCTGNRADSEKPRTFVQLGQTSSSNPLTAPEAGVITKWGVNVIPYPGGISEVLKVVRPAGLNTFTVVGESESKPIAGGPNLFDTRVPIKAGDQIGAASVSTYSPIFCGEEAGGSESDVMGVVEGIQALNSTAAYKPEPKNMAAIFATIEKDADGDGYGDETQDLCPQSATQHAACPVLVLDAVSQPPGKSAVRIFVTSGTPAAIVVSATAKLPGNSKKARVSAQAKLAPVNQLVTPGKIATYTLNFTKSLKDALAALPRKKSVTLKVTASGTGLDGSSSSDKLTVKLKGQAK